MNLLHYSPTLTLPRWGREHVLRSFRKIGSKQIVLQIEKSGWIDSDWCHGSIEWMLPHFAQIICGEYSDT